jgi:hypothetical protein
MDSNPQLTFLMSTYNGRAYLAEAIESVLSQTYAAWRLLVVDDGSTDGSPELAERYEDPRIRVVRMDQNRGQTAALNAGLAMVETPWVARLDQDDLADPERASAQLAYIRGRPSTVLVGSWADYVDEHAEPVGRFRPPTDPDAVRRELYRRPNPILHSAATFRTDTARLLGGYRTDFSYAQDYALWARLATQGEIANVGRVLVSVRRHAQKTSLSPGVSIRQMTEAREVIDTLGSTFRLSGVERRRWQAGRLRVITQRAIAAAHARDWSLARRDSSEVAAGALTNPRVAADLVALVGESVSYRTGLTRRLARNR